MSRPWPVEAFVLDAGALGRSMSNLRAGGFAARNDHDAPRPAFMPGLMPQANDVEHDEPVEPPAPPLFVAEEEPAETTESLLATARAESFAEGFAAGERIAGESLAEDKSAGAPMLTALKGGGAPDREALAHLLHRTVTTIVARLIGDHGVPAEVMAERIGAAVEMLGDATEPASVRLNPADSAMLAPLLGDGVTTIADPAMARGAYRLETRSTLIEDGPDHWIAQLDTAFERLPLPRTA